MYLNDIFCCKTLTLYESYNALMEIVVHWYTKKSGSEWNEAAHGGAKLPLKSVIKESHFWLTYYDCWLLLSLQNVACKYGALS